MKTLILDANDPAVVLHERVRTWARARWGTDRVHNVSFRREGLFVISLDGPPIRGEIHFVRVCDGIFEEVADEDR